MSQQENQVLHKFLQQLREAKVTAKDPEVAALIARAGAAQPDAVYLLVQRALLQDQALQAAQQQIAQLQAQLASVNSTQADSFFGNSSAFRNQNSSSGIWGNSPAIAPATPVTVSAPIGQPASSFFGGNPGSLLGTVAATAAGVAAGAFLFQGLGSLMGASHHPAGAASAAPVNGDSGLIPNSFADDSSTAMQQDSADDMGDFSEG